MWRQGIQDRGLNYVFIRLMQCARYGYVHGWMVKITDIEKRGDITSSAPRIC